ncbi:hypothetical protein KOW79_002129 [Hemibagrus wyckioides]|uniref:Uncharacterized protein n=1 Tax=Hemibagrus wyckioides TaxID=337641 RepID=A0A9D3P784_9TELE|nr:hypothetical protein KOW79_002129 [Hemibagrus wyckioides]
MSASPNAWIKSFRHLTEAKQSRNDKLVSESEEERWSSEESAPASCQALLQADDGERGAGVPAIWLTEALRPPRGRRFSSSPDHNTSQNLHSPLESTGLPPITLLNHN